MPTITKTAILVFLASLSHALALPRSVSLDVECPDGEYGYRVRMAADATCSGDIHNGTSIRKPNYRCLMPAEPPGSVSALSCGDCRIRLWTDGACDGDAFDLPVGKSTCVARDFGSVSIEGCPMTAMMKKGEEGKKEERLY
ncbi:hypothetical protein F4778DRAFT_781581 [Xylariomycetidae sp. FL2044]|nr:hypothetical protein F4778DRAFT_781581 [Xylariomycetidae sp. FL2044]